MHNLTVFINSLTDLIKAVTSLYTTLAPLTSAIILLHMPQGSGPHKKNNQGFASSKYGQEKKRAAQSRGGKAQVPKGFARMSPEKRREVARKGGLS
jgi:hypothetical protein